MPAYSTAVLEDETLLRIYDYVMEIEQPPALDDIPALTEIAN